MSDSTIKLLPSCGQTRKQRRTSRGSLDPSFLAEFLQPDFRFHSKGEERLQSDICSDNDEANEDYDDDNELSLLFFMKFGIIIL